MPLIYYEFILLWKIKKELKLKKHKSKNKQQQNIAELD